MRDTFQEVKCLSTDIALQTPQEIDEIGKSKTWNDCNELQNGKTFLQLDNIQICPWYLTPQFLIVTTSYHGFDSRSPSLD